jgi:predicted dehydrogenase
MSMEEGRAAAGAPQRCEKSVLLVVGFGMWNATWFGMSKVSRRRFLGSLAGAVSAPMILPSRVWADSPSNRLNVGFIGMGKMAEGHLGGFLGFSDVRVVAIAEVAKVRLDHGIERVHSAYAKDRESGTYKGCAGYGDFRELLARRDIDAVVIATPDHWHAIPAILAARAKKDIYCEKPLTVTVSEARAVVNASRSAGVVFQTGSQQRTEFGGKFRTAVEKVRSGRIGKVRRITVGVGGPAKACDLSEEKVPVGIDWEMWLGPAPSRGYSEVLCPKDVHKHFPAWRAYREFAGGGLSDIGAHHFDIAHWAMGLDESGPVEIIPPTDEGAMSGLAFRYSDGLEIVHGGPSGITFEGALGKLFVDRSKIECEVAGVLEERQGAGEFQLPEIGTSHKRNWLDCIRNRARPVADVGVGASTSILCSLANLGYRVRRPLKWDPKREQFSGDAEANGLLSRPARGEWKIA